ncbi:MAG: N-formylglutamate amidohydrolase [Alphaproteobacteria bacterium]|nr:N-formylglutamate amidohydrolase [Alphaproteobacteria bacterium]
MTKPYAISRPKSPLPLIFDSPHSGHIYPDDFRHACAPQDLEKTEDKYVDDLFASVPRNRGVLLAATFPRSYIDVNRAATDIDPELLHEPWPHSEIAPSARSDAGIGLIRRLVKPGVPVYDRVLGAQEVLQRIKNYYEPYHAALEELIAEAHYNYGQAWHINCHSMPSASARPKQAIGLTKEVDFVLGDRDGTSCHLNFTHALRDFLRGLGYTVTINDPFKGVELVRRYSNPSRGFHSIQLEINKSLYMDEETGKKSRGYNALKANVEKLVSFCADFADSNLMDMAAD